MTTSENQKGNFQDLKVRSRAGLYDTLWPVEQADLWRTQTVPSGGLPAGFDKDKLKKEAIHLDVPVTGYTRNKDQVFVMGGTPFSLSNFTRIYMNGTTYEPLNPEDLKRNRDHIPYIAKIDPLTLKAKIVQLTLGRNRSANYPGGALMHNNGYVYAVVQTYLYKIDPDTMEILNSVELPLVEGDPEIKRTTIYNGVQVLGNGRIILKCFTALNMGTGWIIQVDQDSLEILVAKSIKITSARQTIDSQGQDHTYAYDLSLSESTRYLVTNNDFVLDTEWTAVYRDENSKSTTWANASVFMKSHAVFPDNAAPSDEISEPMHTFYHPINNPPTTLKGEIAVSKDPGINFWKLAGDPYSNDDHGLLITFTPTNKKIAAIRLHADGTTVRVWEKDYLVSTQPAIVSGSDHLYINDFNNGHDNFVVLRLSTGDELAYLPLPDSKETTMGTIFPGMNNDVYLSSTNALGDVNSGLFYKFHIGE